MKLVIFLVGCVLIIFGAYMTIVHKPTQPIQCIEEETFSIMECFDPNTGEVWYIIERGNKTWV